MKYPIYIYGHPLLRKESQDIDKNFENLDELIDDMFETLHFAEGIGLAAPQIGKNIRVFVVDGTPYADEEPQLKAFINVFLNPHIIEIDGEIVPMSEGCLSIPNIREDVDRQSRIRIQYYDKDWIFHDEVIEGYKARIIQHEYDHLDGRMFTDKVSPIRRRLLKGKLSGISKGKFDVHYKSVLGK